jgi:hypothetical protein
MTWSCIQSLCINSGEGQYGRYEPQCGLMSVLLNWSGAEYMH